MAQHILAAQDGALTYTGDFLLFFYRAGDCDRIAWPKPEPLPTDSMTWEQMLAGCIFDAVETGEIEENHGEFTVVLPDQTVFNYLEHVKWHASDRRRAQCRVTLGFPSTRQGEHQVNITPAGRFWLTYIAILAAVVIYFL